MPTLDVLIASDTSHRELGPLLRERSNYRVTFANNYAEAVVLLRALRVSVVLIDAQLDDGKGFELAEFVHKSLPETEIVLVADKNLDRDSAEVFGAFAVMSDVVSHAELAFKIEQALAHHRLRMEQATLTRTATEMDAMSAMGKLALHLAHEIRNPLNAAVLQLHLLERDVEK
ncbi:MAG: hypothetical protein KBF88_17515, partial [Polyangiaceae bacterium]|nr:hypothetical protein [Polyangiaceae bacterium]